MVMMEPSKVVNAPRALDVMQQVAHHLQRVLSGLEPLGPMEVQVHDAFGAGRRVRVTYTRVGDVCAVTAMVLE